MRIDYPSLEILHARARRERAEMVYRLLIAPVIRLLKKRPAAAVTAAPLRSRLA
ncbi:MAG TPA: hypothetical protein VNU64_01460 [Burkholderiales bacterium]|nr:hypothetical protein [Burkholderiales bacterium]